ncbi:MAG: hypothetical protein WBM66_12855 [Thiothrix litoralis]
MEHFPYKHAAIFANEVAVKNVTDRIQQADHPDIHVVILQPGSEHTDPVIRRKIIQDGVSGSAGGAIGAAVASLGAVSLKNAVFAIHPFLAGLAAVGYGTLLGGAGGTIYGKLKSDAFLQALDEALKNGHWVVIVHSTSQATDQQISQLLEQTFTEDMV